MFGLKIVTKKGFREIETAANNKAVSELVTLLRKKDKIILEPMTLFGDGQQITDCVFLGIGGSAITVWPRTNRQ